MARRKGKQPTKKRSTRKRRAPKRAEFSAPIAAEFLATVSPTVGAAPKLPRPELTQPVGPMGVSATDVGAPLGAEVAVQLTGVGATGAAGNITVDTVSENAPTTDTTEVFAVRAAARSSMRASLYVKPAADSYTVPDTLRPALADARASIIPHLDEIKTIIGRIEPVLISPPYKRWIGHNRPPAEIDEEIFTLTDARITLFADRTARTQLSPDQPSIDREVLALAWRGFKGAANAAAKLLALLSSGAALALGEDLVKDPTQFHQDILNLQSKLDFVATTLWHLLRSFGAPL